MYRQLKDKYQQRLQDKGMSSGAALKPLGKPKEQAANKEGARRRRLVDLLSQNEKIGNSKMTEEEKVLLKEAILLRKIGKL